MFIFHISAMFLVAFRIISKVLHQVFPILRWKHFALFHFAYVFDDSFWVMKYVLSYYAISLISGRLEPKNSAHFADHWTVHCNASTHFVSTSSIYCPRLLQIDQIIVTFVLEMFCPLQFYFFVLSLITLDFFILRMYFMTASGL